MVTGSPRNTIVFSVPYSQKSVYSSVGSLFILLQILK